VHGLYVILEVLKRLVPYGPLRFQSSLLTGLYNVNIELLFKVISIILYVYDSTVHWNLKYNSHDKSWRSAIL
jgi:hypothetical protein